MLGTFLVLFLFGFSVVAAMSIPSLVYIIINKVPLSMVATKFHFALDSFPLIAVPIFIFAGNLMNTSGITKRLFDFADAVVGRMYGGLAQVNIFASLIFAGMSGAALADVGGLGQVEIKAMTEKGFTKEYSTAVTIASATVGPIFPPSIPLVIFGAATGTSIVKLLLSGIVPAIIAVVTMMLLTVYLAVKKKFPRRTEKMPRKVFRAIFVSAIPTLLAPVILVGGMLTGLFTPTETSSVCVVYILVLGMAVYKELTPTDVVRAAKETLQQTSSMCVIIAAAALFGWILTVEQSAKFFSNAMAGFVGNDIILLILLNVMLIFAGMFMDSTTATLVLIPLVMPTMVAAGIDPVHLGIVTVFNLMLGMITPPFGLSLFISSRVGNVTIPAVTREVAIYYLPLGFTLFIITFFPKCSLWMADLFF
jgi:tripartite ATP-independent transporter DctM subunit